MQTIAVEHASANQAKVVKIEWNMGKRCNFHCSYCDEFTHDNKSKHMSFEVAKRTIDKIVSKGKKYKDLEEKYRVEHIKRTNSEELSDTQQQIYRDLMDMLKEISIFIDLIVERLGEVEKAD